MSLVVELLHPQEYVQMQKPATAVLYPDKQETGKDIKQKSRVEFDLPTAKPDKIKMPKVCHKVFCLFRGIG